VSAEDRADAESKIAALREALKGADLDAVRGGATALAETLTRIGTAAYQAPAGAASGDDSTNGSGAGDEGGPAAAEEGAPAGEETVEGEYKEV
jgi:molecular chaperone DnaK